MFGEHHQSLCAGSQPSQMLGGIISGVVVRPHLSALNTHFGVLRIEKMMIPTPEHMAGDRRWNEREHHAAR
jgi:hypothetical protein